MPEPILTISVLATATASWLLTKGLDWSAGRLWAGLSPQDFKQHLDKAWRNDAALRAACDPPPTFDYSRLTQERWRRILECVLENDEAGLGNLLFSEQLIDLPWANVPKPKPAREIGTCTARVIIQAASRAIATDSRLRGEFELFVAQTHTAKEAAILAELQQIQSHTDAISSQIQQHELASAQRDVELSTKMTTLLERDEERQQLCDRVAGMAREHLELNQRLMALLDEKGRTTWQDIQEELRNANLHAACTKAEQLRDWLVSEGQNASSKVQGRGYLLLAHLALMAPRDLATALRESGDAEALFQEALTRFGNDSTVEENALLARFRARAFALRGEHNSALAALSPFDDPDSTLTKLAILIDAERYEGGYALIESRPLESQWADEAIVVGLHTRHDAKAQEILDWGIKSADDNLVDRCRLAFARTQILLTHAPSTQDGTAIVSPLDTSPDQRRTYATVLDILEPTLLRVRASGRINTGHEADILALGYACNRGLGQVEVARDLIRFLGDIQPIREEFVRAVFRRDVPCSTTIADRLRADYPSDNEMQLLALDIEWNCSQKLDGILSSLQTLHDRASSSDERRKIAHFAFELATSKEPVHDPEKTALRRLCSADDQTGTYLSIHDLIVDGRLDEATKRLAELSPDDMVAMQLNAEIKARQGQLRDSAKLLASVGRRMPEPFFLRKAAFLLRSVGDRTTAIELLESSLLLDPNHLQAMAELAMLRVDVGDYLRAADLFATLSQFDETGYECELNQSKCLALAGEIDKALGILEVLCSAPGAPLVVLSSKAQLLTDMDQAPEALALLRQHKDAGWNDATFVCSYMDVAYHANRDAEAGEAFQQLVKLRQHDAQARELLQPHSTDELIALIEQGRKTHSFVSEQLRYGRIPWILAERLNNNPVYWGWFIRTQPLRWCSENLVSSSSYTIYASNGYSVLIDVDGSRRVLPIQCSPRGQHVVADLSALITLDRLGLLEAFLNYAEKVFLPHAYLATVLTDGSRLLPHQPSQLEEQKTVYEAVRSGRLKVVADDQLASAQLVDEYRDDKAIGFSASTLVAAIEAAGEETSAETNGDSICQLDIEKPIVASLATLQYLVREHQFERTVNCVQLVISKTDYQAVLDAIANADARREVREWHLQMWERLRTNPSVAFNVVNEDRVQDQLGDETDDPSDRILALEAISLAQQLDVPLVADDRLCQTMRLNEHPDCAYSAFGSAQIVEALSDAGAITLKQATDSLLQLMKWRYRFIVLGPKTLRGVFDLHGLSGLHVVASYVHACMRDRGLFGGLENADLKLPMAFRLFQDWERLVAGFVASVWVDTSIEIGQAQSITEWAITEFLPAIPINLRGMEPRLAVFGPSTVIAQLLFDLLPLQDVERAHEALLCVARHLGLTFDQYLQLCGEVITSEYGQD